jgi:hypothetical protein
MMLAALLLPAQCAHLITAGAVFARAAAQT